MKTLAYVGPLWRSTEEPNQDSKMHSVVAFVDFLRSEATQ